MMSPDQIKETLAMLKTALSKIAVVVVTQDDQRYLVSQNQHIISVFHPTEGHKDFAALTDPESNLVACYEIRFNKTITIDASNVKYLEFIGVPEEIAPPLYLNPRFEGAIPNEALVELQTPTLLEIKDARDRGCFVDEPYDDERVYKLNIIKGYIQERLNLSFEDHPIFSIFRNPLLNNFHLYSNKKDGDRVLELAERLYFMPAILACYDKNIDTLTKSQIIDFIDSDSVMLNLKDNWIKRLDNYRKKYIENTIKEKELANNFLDTELKDKLSLPAVQKLIKRALNKELSLAKNVEAYNTQLNTLILLVKSNCSDEFTFTDEINDKIDELIATFSTNVDSDPEVSAVFSKEAVKQFINTAVNNILQIKEQYTLIINESEKIDFAKELKYLTDYRLYLRYWPDIFQVNEAFHDSIRPLTSLELQTINALLHENVEIEYNKLFPGFINESNAYNSILNELQDKIELMKQKRLDQIKSVSQERVQEIKNEMSQLYDTMGDEEKKLFDDMIKEISDIEKYKSEIDGLTRLIDVLMYWPLPLYPKPENVVKS